jgi:hypothetical protein
VVRQCGFAGGTGVADGDVPSPQFRSSEGEQMLTDPKRAARLIVAAAALGLVAPACAPLAADTRGGYPAPRTTVRTSTMQGEIRTIDHRQSRMQLRDTRGRNQIVEFDRRTVVVYNNRQYRVSQLQRGDQVRVRVQSGYGRYPIANRVEVRRAARDRGGWDDRGRATATRVERIEGTVGRVDPRRGVFTLQRAREGTITVYLPNRVSNADNRRFERLRRGERVRAEVRMTQRNTAELVRFR